MTLTALGRPREITQAQCHAIVEAFLNGRSVSDVARHHALRVVTVETVIRQAVAILLRQAPATADAPAETPAETIGYIDDTPFIEPTP
jgi:hypothetical protein